MSSSSDHVFIYPDRLFSAKRVNIYEAINAVVYAKLPLYSGLVGTDLVAGFIDGREPDAAVVITRDQAGKAIAPYAARMAKFEFPVSPRNYEPLLISLLDKGEALLPYFYHEHHEFVRAQNRAIQFAAIYRSLNESVQSGEITVQSSDTERADILTAESWMTKATFLSFIDRHGVTPWWEDESNRACHPRITALLLSDRFRVRAQDPVALNPELIPSLAFAKRLVSLTHRPGFDTRRLSSAASVEAPLPVLVSNTDAKSHQRQSPAVKKNVGAPDSDSPTRVLASETLQSPDQGLDDAKPPTEQPRQLIATGGSLIGDASVDPGDEKLIGIAEVALMVDSCANTVRNWYRKEGSRFPQPLELGTHKLTWLKSDIIKWMLSGRPR